MRGTRRAFTIIELLVVVAVTAILLVLIVAPIFQSFNITRQAQTFATAQARARLLTEQIGEEVGNAAAVRDNTGAKGSITVIVPNSTKQ